MDFDNAACYCQAQPGASGHPAAGFLAPIKAVENARQILRSDSCARIGYFYTRSTNNPACNDLHLPARRGVTDGVAQQVVEHSSNQAVSMKTGSTF